MAVSYVADNIEQSSRRSSKHGFPTEEAAWKWISQHGLCKDCREQLNPRIQPWDTHCGMMWDVIPNSKWNEYQASSSE